MKYVWKLLTCLAACALALGCDRTRSISNSSYDGRVGAGMMGYQGELSELDVLGIAPSQKVSESDIQKALQAAGGVQLKTGSTLLLIQSGAAFPDGAMVTELSKNFRVVPFSGLPAPQSRKPRESRVTSTTPVRYAPGTIVIGPDDTVTLRRESGQPAVITQTESTPADAEEPGYATVLRLAAARAGAETVVCYWGVLESASEKMATKTVSWIPVAGWVLPDERQQMRIRVKVAVIDVRTGNWSVASVEPPDSQRWSTGPGRAAADQRQVESLKKQAYTLAAAEITKRYAR